MESHFVYILLDESRIALLSYLCVTSAFPWLGLKGERAYITEVLNFLPDATERTFK